MKYTLTTPCKDCPFLKKHSKGYSLSRLKEFAQGQFHCHKTGEVDEENRDFIPTDKSYACAGMLIFNEKRKAPNQMMRISERLGMYDYRKLDMKAPVR